MTERLIGIVRDWLSTSSGGRPLPGGGAIADRYSSFTSELPAITEAFHLKGEELTFSNYVNIASDWLKRVLVGTSDPAA